MASCGPGMHEANEQLERVPVGRDRTRAGPALIHQAVGEEALQGGSDQAHRAITSADSSRRPAASANSSGAAEKYQ